MTQNIPINSKTKKSPGITFVLNFFVLPGIGFIYLGDKYTNRGIIYIVVTIVLAFLSIITAGIGIPFLFLWDVFVIVTGFSATDEYNRSLETGTDKNSTQGHPYSTFDQQSKEKHETLSQRVKCFEFVESLEKFDKLLKNDIITEEEFLEKKQKLINNIVLYKVVENPEDFLSVIIDLKAKNILLQDDLQKIKKAIL